jgi:hypothetical protein
VSTDLPKDSPEGSSGETPEETSEGTPAETLEGTPKGTPEGTPKQTPELPFPELRESQAGGPEGGSRGERQKETQDQSRDQFEGHPQVPIASKPVAPIASADPAGEDALEDALGKTLGTLKDAAQSKMPHRSSIPVSARSRISGGKK